VKDREEKDDDEIHTRRRGGDRDAPHATARQ
jgi:hypothetical protein